MNKIKSIFKWCDTQFNKVVQKGGDNVFFEYLVKYLIACGIGLNIFALIVIITKYVT